MPLGRLIPFTAVLGAALAAVTGLVLVPASAAAPPRASVAGPAASLALSSPAARAKGVTYTVGFTPSSALKAGTSTLTLTAPSGTVLPAVIADVYDRTAGQDLGAFPGGKRSRGGATATWTAAAAIPAGHLIDLTLAGVTNPPAGTYSLGIATSAQRAALATAPYHVTPPRAVRSPLVSFAGPDSQASYPVQFTTSPSGALAAGYGTITLTAPKGTILPYGIADLYDVTTGTDLGPLPGGVLTDNGAAGTWTVATTIPAGHVIDLLLDGVRNPAPGSYELGIATSSDTVTARARYTISSSALQFYGAVGAESLDCDVTCTTTVQACSSTACATTQSGVHGLFSLSGLAPGEYTLTAYPLAVNAGGVGEQTVGPFDVGAGTLFNPVILLPTLNPAPAGVVFDGQSGTVPTVYWDSPAPLSVPGCAGGTGVAVVSAYDPATGTPDVELGRLTESPAGSGTYTATVPPLDPAHGTVTVAARSQCSPPTALLPSDGPAGGGNEVRLTGSGFTGATAVLFGGKPAKSFTVVSGTEIDAVAPAGSGTVAVSVRTPRGTIAAASLAEYTYLSLASVYPAGGPAAGGQSVTISGHGLTAVAAVYFGSTPASHVTAVSGTEITATDPAGKPGTTVPVTILTADGGQTSAGAVRFTYWVPDAKPAAAAAPAAVTGGQATTAAAAPALPPGSQTARAPGDAGAFTQLSPFAQALAAAGVIVKKMTSSCVAAHAGTAFTTALTGALAQAAADLGKPGGWAGAAGGLTGGAADLLSGTLQDLNGYGLLPSVTEGGLTVAELIAVGALTAAFTGLARHGASLAALRADLGCAAVILYSPPSPAPSPVTFQASVLPTVRVVDISGHPVPGATVTLLAAPDAAQPFSPLAAGSPNMDPSVNPQTTNANGIAGWDVIGGRYEITAQKTGCSAPGDPGQPLVTSPVFRGVPPAAGLVLTLSCPG